MAGKMQGATGRIASELSTGSINTASSVSTGRRWSFGSFSQMGNTASYGMTWNDRFGRTSDVHLQDTGWLGSGNFGLDNGSVQTFSEQMKSLTGIGGPNLGSGRITGMIGRKDGNSYELHAGYMGDLAITKGTNFVVDDKGNITGVIHGFDRQTGREWTLEFSGGKLVSAKSKAGGSGEAISYRQGQDGVAYATLETANVTQGVMFNKDGDTVTSLSMPDKVNAVDAMKQTAENQVSVLQNLTDTTKVADAFKSGNSHVKQKALDYAYTIGSSEQFKGSQAQRFVQSAATSAIEQTAMRLASGNENMIRGGHRIEDEGAFKREIKANAGIRLNDTIVGKLLNKVSGLNLGIEGSVGKMWISRDAMYVETSDGTYYRFDLSDEAKKEFRKNFEQALSTDKTHITDYKTGDNVSFRDGETYNQQKESFFSKVAELARQDITQYQTAQKSLAEKGMNINKDLMRHLVDAIHDKTGRSYNDIINEINENPSKIEDYLRDKEIFNEVSNRLFGNTEFASTMNNVADRSRQNSEYLRLEDGIRNAIVNGDREGISRYKEQVEQAYENGQITQQQFNKLMDRLRDDRNTQLTTDVPSVQNPNLSKDDAVSLAVEKGIGRDNADKAFDSGMANDTKGKVAEGENTIGATPKLKGGMKYLQEKYGEDVGQGLKIERMRLNHDVEKFNKKLNQLSEEMQAKGIYIPSHNFTYDDYRTGKALDILTKDVSKGIEKAQDTIDAYEKLKNNEHIWNSLPEDTKRAMYQGYEKAKEEMRVYGNLLAEVAVLQTRMNEYEKDQQLYTSIKNVPQQMDKVTYGEKPVDGWFDDPHKETNYPPYKGYTEGPEIKFPRDR